MGTMYPNPQLSGYSDLSQRLLNRDITYGEIMSYDDLMSSLLRSSGPEDLPFS